MIIEPHELLRFLVATHGHAKVINAVRRAIDRCKSADDFTGDRRQYLSHLGHYALYAKAIKGEEVIDCVALAQLLEALQIKCEDFFHYQARHAPWDVWIPGKKVVIVVGGKYMENPTSQFLTQVSQDVTAIIVLDRTLRDARIQYVSELLQVDPNMSVEGAEGMLDRTCRRQDVGAVVVLGSEAVNPLAAPIARRIFRETSPRGIPFRFRWSYPTKIQKPFLTSPKAWRPDQEGIAATLEEEATALPRMQDAEIVEALKQGRRSSFPDCGILAMSTNEDTLLILCSGHGPAGTTAAVHALSRMDYIERVLDGSVGVGPSFTPHNTILEPIRVRRRKLTFEMIDDFVFDSTYGKGWSFYFDEEERPDGEDEPVHEIDPMPTPPGERSDAEPADGSPPAEPKPGKKPANRTKKKR